jgi:putative alpha-1,2-mannosidase
MFILKNLVNLALLLFLFSVPAAAQKDLTQYVNPFIGTGGHGHTFPGAIVPFGMVQLSPDTRLTGWDGCSGYHYSDSIIHGFSHTHLSGTGISDYGDILLIPAVGRDYSGRFQHQNEKATPGYYSVKLDDENILVELTATACIATRSRASKTQTSSLTSHTATKSSTTGFAPLG